MTLRDRCKEWWRKKAATDQINFLRGQVAPQERLDILDIAEMLRAAVAQLDRHWIDSDDFCGILTAMGVPPPWYADPNIIKSSNGNTVLTVDPNGLLDGRDQRPELSWMIAFSVNTMAGHKDDVPE